METYEIEFIPEGTVTTPEGFYAGAVSAGIKKKPGLLDLGVLFSRTPCAAAGLFTTSKLKAAAVTISQKRLKSGRATAIAVNAGCANAYTGEQGLADAEAFAALAGASLGIAPQEVLLASTGITGKRLPMDKIEKGIREIALDRDGGHDLACAIMTTDTVPKEFAVAVKCGDATFSIGGIAKGSGMIHPNMATMFCFLATDAAVEINFLKTALKNAADKTLNMISVDGDTSPSDSVILLANGEAKNKPITDGTPQAAAFQQALDAICTRLAKMLARDGEGATRLIEATVSGARTLEEARLAARTIIGSALVKTAVYGGDPNWGRILAAVARSGAEVAEDKVDLIIGEVAVLQGGKALPYQEADVSRVFRQEEVPIFVNLNLGGGIATAWGCDMSEAYVKINSEYMT